MIILTWVFDLLAILLSVGALFLNRRDVKAFQRDEDLFNRICVISVVITIFKLVEDTITPGLDIASFGVSSLIISFVYDIFDLALLYVWILFVDYMICRSEDHLRIVKIRISGLLGMVAVIETILMGVAFWAVSCPKGSSWVKSYLPLVIWIYLSYYLLRLIEGVLLFISVNSLSLYRGRRKGSVLFRGIPFYIPIFFGWLITILVDYRVDLNPFATGLGVFMLYFSMRKERRFIDSKTGFFSVEYLTVLPREKKSKLGILVHTDDDVQVLVDILKRVKPEEIDIVYVSEGTFFLTGERKPGFIIEIFRENLLEIAEEEGIHLTMNYDNCTEEESAQELMERLCG